MSKRQAGNWGGDEDRFGGAPPTDMDSNDKPVQATAAQLARRKLLKPRARTDRGRSDSPAVQTGFGQTSTNPFSSQTFNFGGQQQQQQQQTNGAFTFGQSAPVPTNNGMTPSFSQSSAPSFGGFGATATQPQQNGLGGSNSLFNQPSQQSSTPSFNFGASQPSQQNGTTTPATSFGGLSDSQPTTQNGFGSNGFTGFGQKPQENGTTGSMFGQQAQENGLSRASTPGFGNSFAAKAPQPTNNNLFGSKPQENGNAGNIFGQQKAPESNTTAPNPFAGFGNGLKPAENSSTTSLFPASQPQEQTPKPSLNIFGQPPSTQPAGPSTGLFGANATTSISAPGTSLFGSTPTSTASAPGTGLFGSKTAPNEPAKSGASIFDNLPKKDTSGINFSSADPKQVYNGEDDGDETSGANAESATEPTPANNLFANFGSTSAAKPATNIFAKDTGNKDTSINAPAATPQRSLFSNGASAAAAPVSSTPAAQPQRSLFDRIGKPQPAETPMASLFGNTLGAETPKASIFSTTPAAQTPKASMFGNTPAPPSTAKPLFSSGATTTPAPLQSQQPSVAPEEDATPKATAPKSFFAQSAFAAPSTPAVAPTAPAVSTTAPPATAPLAAPTSTPAASLSAGAASADLDESQKENMKALNEGLLGYLQAQNVDTDWSAIFRFAITTAAQITGRPATSELATITAPPAKSTSSQPSAHVPSGDSSTAAPAAPVSAINSFAQTPKAGPSSSLFSKVPATAPSKKRSFEEDADETSRVPATEKRSKPNEPASYPKLPETASNTAKLFASTLDKPAVAEAPKSTASSGFTPSTKLLFSTSASTPAATPALGGFKPTLGNAATPTAGGFKPTLPAAAPGNSFLSSFGALAKKNEEVERQKRKDADYDSDEETEEQWAKRDAAEQEEKRRKFAAAAKSVPSFTIGSTTPKSATTAATVEKAQGAGDKTWTPETPLQFGNGTATNTPAAAPPKFGNAFGSAFGASATPAASSTLAPPATSSLNASRATTPGATTDGEGSSVTNGDKGTADDGEPSDEPNQPQASEEINDLQPAEREANEVLLEVQDVRTSKMEKDDESGKQTWKPKTRGRFFILKDKENGKVRMLSRTGAGRTVLNHMPNKEATFKVHPKKATMIVASLFVDHMHSTPPGPGQWMFSTPDKDDAEKIARLLTEGTPK